MIKKVFDSADSAADALARFIINEISFTSGYFNMALSGGSTPARLFRVLAENYETEIDWKRVRLFWVDERCVPPDHKESNFRMTKETLLEKVNIQKANIFRIKGEDDPAGEAKRYEELIRSQVPFLGNLPSFDLVLLGMGEDGHTASIFPDQIRLMRSEKICHGALHPQSGQKRITLTGPVINNGKTVVFFLTGIGKREMLKNVLQRDNRFPASYINPAGGNLYFFLDTEANPED